DDRFAGRVGELQELADEREREEPEREADEEQPAPSPVIGDESAGEWARDRGHPEDGAHDALIFTALARGDDVADDHLRERHERAHPDPWMTRAPTSQAKLV